MKPLGYREPPRITCKLCIYSRKAHPGDFRTERGHVLACDICSETVGYDCTCDSAEFKHEIGKYYDS